MPCIWTPGHAWLLSLLTWSLVLCIRARYNKTSLWIPVSWRQHWRSRGISHKGSEWFYAQSAGPPRPVRRDTEVCTVIITKERKFNNREPIDYLPALMGSLLQSTDATMRDRMTLVTYFFGEDYADTLSYQHLVRSGLADIIITDPDPDDMADWLVQAQATATDEIHAKLALENRQYLWMMQACLERTDAPFIILLEDDTVAEPDWLNTIFNRLLPTLPTVRATWLYVLLYYPSNFFGWQNDEAPAIVRVALILSATGGVIGFVYRQKVGRSGLPLHRVTSRRRAWLLNGTFLLLLLPHGAVFMLQGRLAALPLPKGLSVDYPSLGWGGQAVLFSRSNITIAQKLLFDIQSRNSREFTLRRFCADNDPKALLWHPSLFQHTGSWSSKTGKPTKQFTNYDFEAN